MHLITLAFFTIFSETDINIPNASSHNIKQVCGRNKSPSVYKPTQNPSQSCIGQARAYNQNFMLPLLIRSLVPTFIVQHILFLSFPLCLLQNVRTQSYKNPFDISREELLDQVSRMRINFFHTAATSTRLQDEGKFSIPLDFYRNCSSFLFQPFPQPQILCSLAEGAAHCTNIFHSNSLVYQRTCKGS